MRTKELFAWIKERHAIYTKRQDGKPKPWTRDPIMQSYRFCNVYRELDTVTQWIRTNWREPHASDDNLWFAMVVARLLNWPDTLEVLGYPSPWDKAMRKTFLALNEIQNGKKVFNSAYIVSTNGHAMDKLQYLAQYVLDPLWAARHDIAQYCTHLDGRGMGLQTFHAKLMRYDGLGSFMAAQVVCDLKYVAPLNTAPDWHVWAASGPGSRRGLNRVLGLEVDRPWREADWLHNLQVLHGMIRPLVLKAGMPDLHAQDLQNCLCEFDKYERTRLGEGTPRNKYPGL